eukprot:gene25301-31741_t
MPVIGGYLAYIGFFCGQAGLAMMGGVKEPGLEHYLHPHRMLLMLPGASIGIMMYVLLRNVRSPFVLPITLMVVLSGFYLCMYLMGGSFEDARAYGWIAPLSPLEPFYHSWLLYDVTLVDWTTLPIQAVRLVCMFLVVAFSSSLDVAAIEMEVGLPLDYNTELFTVGMSNVASGLLGGYTGSYIFSQTIFNLRRRVSSRLCGYTVAVCELIVVVLPVSVTSFIPKLFFGALLVLIAVDLMTEWLIGSRSKMTSFEYAVCLMTFLCILYLGIEIGMMIGVLLAMMSFVVTYARLQSVSVASLLSSTVVRTFEERAILIANRGKVVTISLNGYIFFGSAVNILEEVKSHVVISPPSPQGSPSSSPDPEEDDVRRKRGGLLGAAVGGSAKESSENRPLLNKATRSMSYSGVSPTKIQDADFETLHSGHMMPRYSFALTKQPTFISPQKGAPSPRQQIDSHSNHNYGRDNHHHQHLQYSQRGHHKRPSTSSIASKDSASHELLISTSDHRPQPHSQQQINNSSSQSYQMSSPGIIASLLFTHSNSNSNVNTSTRSSFSEDALSPSNSTHQPGRKKRNVSFDATQKDPNTEAVPPGTALVDIESGSSRAQTMAECMSEAVKLANAKQQDKVVDKPQMKIDNVQDKHHKLLSPPPPQDVVDSVLGGNGEDSPSPVVLPVTSIIQKFNDTNLQTKKEKDLAQTLPASSSTPKRKSKSLFATIWANQTVKRERIHDSIEDLSPRRARSNSQQREQDGDRSSRIPRVQSGMFSPVDTRRLKPAASVLKQVSAFPDIAFDSANAADIESGYDDVSTEYLVLDFSHVLGVDATAARSCFMMLVQLMKRSGVTVVFAHMSYSIESMLRNQRVIKEGDIVIPSLDDALEWCEEQVLHGFITHSSPMRSEFMDLKRNPSYYTMAHKQRQEQSTLRARSDSVDASGSDEGLSGFSGGLTGSFYKGGSSSQGIGTMASSEEGAGRASELVLSLPVNAYAASAQPQSANSLRKILADYLETDAGSHPLIDGLLTSELLLKYFRYVSYTDRELVFDVEDDADQVYFIEKGMVEIVTLSPTVADAPQTPTTGDTPRIQHNTRINSRSVLVPPVVDSHRVQRVNKVSAGGAFGEADFFLGRKHSVRAYTLTACDCWLLNREGYANMEVQHPTLCLLIQHTLLKSLSISSTCSMYSLNTATSSNRALDGLR